MRGVPYVLMSAADKRRLDVHGTEETDSPTEALGQSVDAQQVWLIELQAVYAYLDQVLDNVPNVAATVEEEVHPILVGGPN